MNYLYVSLGERELLYRVDQSFAGAASLASAVDGGVPRELFRVPSPGGHGMLVGYVQRRAAVGTPITVFLGQGLPGQAAIGPLAVFGMTEAGVHRDLTPDEESSFELALSILPAAPPTLQLTPPGAPRVGIA